MWRIPLFTMAICLGGTTLLVAGVSLGKYNNPIDFAWFFKTTLFGFGPILWVWLWAIRGAQQYQPPIKPLDDAPDKVVNINDHRFRKPI